MSRKCPVCPEENLKPEMTRQGVEVDYCPNCKGIWLDRGELFHFSKDAGRLKRMLEEGFQGPSQETDRKSPVTGENMTELHLLGGTLAVDYSPRSGGFWFDAGELKALLEAERSHLKMSTDSSPTGPGGQSRPRPSPRGMSGTLLTLPNLALRSTSVMVGLYGLLVLVLITISLFLDVPPGAVFIIALVIAGVQFLISPFIMDWSLRWLYSLRWVDLGAFPAGVESFIKQVCADNKMNLPKMGIIDDGAPNAFTYGHTPNNARVVVTRGILELLDEEEVKAVVGHELGHARHWDILLMTVASLVPLLLYYLFRMAARIPARKQAAQVKVAVMVGAYVLYIISQYIVLWFSRIREFYADRFAGEVTGNPSALASALVKIGYGLAAQEQKTDDGAGKGKGKGKAQSRGRPRELEAIGALGIFDSNAARVMAVASYRADAPSPKPGQRIETELIKRAARWDLWNPWATYYEIHSTHPLIAKRLRYLSNQSEAMGQPPFISFDEQKPESFLDEFLVDIAVYLLPLFALILGGGMYLMRPEVTTIGMGIMLLGGAKLLKTLFCYRGGGFPEFSVSGLLAAVKVSRIRPVPCTVRGRIIGKGVPGLIWSEDFVMQDETGIMFLDYRQPLSIWEWLFGLLRAGEYQGAKVVVRGWFRRGPTPFIEIKTIEGLGKTRQSYIYPLKLLLNAFLIGVGVIVAVYGVLLF